MACLQAVPIGTAETPPDHLCYCYIPDFTRVFP